MRAGTYALKPPLPYTPGSDGAGVGENVVARASGVFNVRDRAPLTTPNR
jgi:hypothetical protein